MWFTASALLLVASLPAHVSAAAEGAMPVVTAQGDSLSIQAKEAALHDVMREVGRVTGAEVRGQPAPSAPVTVTLERVPVKEALGRLLGEQSFTLTYADDGKLKAIDLRGGPGEAPVAAATPEPSGWPPSDAARAAAEKVDAWTRSDRRYPVSGRLAEKLGQRTATFPEIAETAVTADDPRVRSQAQRTGLRLLESEPEVRDAFVETVDSVDDAFLVNYCRFFMKDRADEFVTAMGRHARTPALRTRARSVRQGLDVPAPDAS